MVIASYKHRPGSERKELGARGFASNIVSDFAGKLLQQGDRLTDVSSLHEIEKPKVEVKDEYRNRWIDVMGAVYVAANRAPVEKSEDVLIGAFMKEIRRAANEAGLDREKLEGSHLDMIRQAKAVTKEAAVRSGLNSLDQHEFETDFMRAILLKELTLLAKDAGIEYRDKEKAEAVADTLISLWKEGKYPRYDDSGRIVAYSALTTR